MIVTRKAIPRRAILRGLGATVALPLLDAMVPAFGRLAAAAPKTSRLSTIYVGNGANMKTWTPAAEGARLRADADARAARGIPRSDARHLRSRQQAGARAAGRAGRRARPDRRIVPHRRPRQADRGRRLRGRHFDRPDRRARARAADAARLARTQPRYDGVRRSMRRRLQLRLYDHALLARADRAAADGARSACGLRAAVRRFRKHRPR